MRWVPQSSASQTLMWAPVTPGTPYKADSDPVGLRWALRVHISSRTPGGADATGQQTTL